MNLKSVTICHLKLGEVESAFKLLERYGMMGMQDDNLNKRSNLLSLDYP
jgi:hypothetical protein